MPTVAHLLTLARRTAALLVCGLAPAGVVALECPAMPQQASRDAEVEVRVGVRGIGDARGAELATKTRQLTADLMGRLPQADRVYLEQMMFASYCSALKANAALSEAEREARIRAYARELRAGLPGGTGPPAVRVDPRDAARAELARLPVEYTPDAFVAAAERGDARVVGLFIAAGLDVNGADQRNETALAHAARRGDLRVVQALLRAGASVDVRVGRGGTALNWAAYEGRLEVVGAMLNARPRRETVDDAFVSAARGGQLDCFALLLDRGVDVAAQGPRALISVAKKDGDTAARLAIARRLLKAGVPIDAAVDRFGWNLLLSAIDEGHLDMVRFALDAGSDINRRCDCSNYTSLTRGGLTPLGVAVTTSTLSVEIVDLLLARGADVGARTYEGRTPLLLALNRMGPRDSAVVTKLLAARSDPNAQDSHGDTPLVEAAASRSLAGMQLLLDAGADVNARSRRGRTPLMVAVLSGEPEAVRLLLQRGARAELKDEDGKTAEAHASEALKGDAQTRMLTTLRRGGTR
jgi:ankyrin repeat protein